MRWPSSTLGPGPLETPFTDVTVVPPASFTALAMTVAEIVVLEQHGCGARRRFVQPAHQKLVKAVKPVSTANKEAPPSRLDGAKQEEKLQVHFGGTRSIGHPSPVCLAQ